MTTSNTERPWRAVAVSEVGASHVRGNKPCQDASQCFASRDVLVACVADGAGSAKYSDEGARAAVEEFVAMARDLLLGAEDLEPEEIVYMAFEAARQAVRAIADGDITDYATTLLGVVVRRGSLAAIQLGDGAVIVDGEVVMDSHEGEYANETKFITNPEAEPAAFAVSGDISRVAIITDGLENLVLENNGYQRVPHGPFFGSMFEWLHSFDEPDRTTQLTEFLASERVQSRTTDDVTLLLAMR